MAGRPISLAAEVSSEELVMRRNAVTGSPAFDRNVFSRKRCWVVWRTAPLGRTGAQRAAAAAVSAGTFSNSNVTTETPLANLQIASRSSYGALISTSATCPVGVSASGDKV